MYIVISEYLIMSPEGNVRTETKMFKAYSRHIAEKYKEKNRNKIVKVYSLWEFANLLKSVKEEIDNEEMYLL